MSHHPIPKRQRGVIMVIALITLAVLLVGAAIAMRSMNATLGSVGNFGFKRDMANRAEVGVRAATDALKTGALSTQAARQTTDATQNYSAKLLPSDASGIPLAMLNMTAPSTLNGLGNAVNEIQIPADGLRVTYMIDRLCSNDGAFNAANCLVAGVIVGGGSLPRTPLLPAQPTYRITVRVMGPHDAYSFFQSTFTTQN